MPAARITDQHGGSIRRNLKSESESESVVSWGDFDCQARFVLAWSIIRWVVVNFDLHFEDAIHKYGHYSHIPYISITMTWLDCLCLCLSSYELLDFIVKPHLRVLDIEWSPWTNTHLNHHRDSNKCQSLQYHQDTPLKSKLSLFIRCASGWTSYGHQGPILIIILRYSIRRSRVFLETPISM